jgi:hypothetical protein
MLLVKYQVPIERNKTSTFGRGLDMQERDFIRSASYKCGGENKGKENEECDSEILDSREWKLDRGLFISRCNGKRTTLLLIIIYCV